MDYPTIAKNEQLERITKAEKAMVDAADALHYCLPKADPLAAILLLDLLGQARTFHSKLGQIRDAVSCHKTQI